MPTHGGAPPFALVQSFSAGGVFFGLAEGFAEVLDGLRLDELDDGFGVDELDDGFGVDELEGGAAGCGGGV